MTIGWYVIVAVKQVSEKYSGRLLILKAIPPLFVCVCLFCFLEDIKATCHNIKVRI